MTGLRIDGLMRTFGGLTAVAGISMDIPPGRVTGLIGPNGAGKTTVVNLISGLLKATEGTIRLGERDVTTADAVTLAKAGVARTFQNIRLIPHASALENVLAGFHLRERTGLLANLLALPAARRERADLEAEALALMRAFGMDRWAATQAGNLSYGHQRKIEMMRALALQPKVLLLDEPVAGMNDVEAAGLAETFRTVARQGVAILLIEHNMRFVMSLCDRIYVLASGRMIAEGEPDAVRNNPHVIEAYLGA